MPKADKEAVQHARDLVAADPYSVSAHAMLIRVLSAAGHRQEAERQHEISVRELSDAGAEELKTLTEALSARRPAIEPTSVDQEPGKHDSNRRYVSAPQAMGCALHMRLWVRDLL